MLQECFKFDQMRAIFWCNRILPQTCLNLTMRNQSGVDKVALVSLLLTWDMLTRVSTVSARDNDRQANTVGKEIDPMASYRLN